MPNSQGQIQVQTESQIQKLSPQQLLAVKLIELPLADLEERIKNEVIDNIALEEGRDRQGEERDGDEEERGLNDDGHDMNEDAEENEIFEEEESRHSEYDDYASADDVPSYIVNKQETEGTEIPIGDSRSFIDDLMAQMFEFDLTEHQQDLIEYLIGSLNDNGFIDRPLSSIADELLFNLNIETDEKELESVLHILQQFEPIGIGARNPQECLLLQIDDERNKTDEKEVSKIKILELEREIILNHYDLFLNKNFDKLQMVMNVSPTQLSAALDAIRRLNPRPGRALCESSDDRAQTIIPDFIVETEGDNINMWLNEGDIPELHISRKYAEQLAAFQKNADKMRNSEKEAFMYIKQKVDGAKMFIESINQRRRTLSATMRAIIELQRDFILTQDEETLHPMILRNVAEKAKLDISTVSRVSNSKYALVDGNIYPLKHFFMRTRANAEGEEVMGTKVISALKDIINGEDKRDPLSDMLLVDKLKAKGLNLSRRTVAKYRKSMGIPTAKDRKAI